jgi:hypothetical protein
MYVPVAVLGIFAHFFLAIFWVLVAIVGFLWLRRIYRRWVAKGLARVRGAPAAVLTGVGISRKRSPWVPLRDLEAPKPSSTSRVRWLLSGGRKK